ncbi:PilX N-terminal domain-containing pilus assembly protein [Aquabacterium sp.]|uniref:pilus assembly PilX family protein n=1 Tax=Aquabacterium sp. TaxID=1872578 RepID=UPI0035C672AA
MALLVVLIFTLALTGIAIVSARLAVQGESMARNQLDSQVARQAAEAALRDAERDLMLANGDARPDAPCARGVERPVVGSVPPDTACTHGQCAHSEATRRTANFATATSAAPGEPWWPVASGGRWNNNPATKPSRLDHQDGSQCAGFTGAVPLGVYTGVAPIQGVVQQPEYLIEHIRRAEQVIFRITARGFGYRPGTEVVVQSYFRVPDL